MDQREIVGRTIMVHFDIKSECTGSTGNRGTYNYGTF
jgi:hypothetical protein